MINLNVINYQITAHDRSLILCTLQMVFEHYKRDNQFTLVKKSSWKVKFSKRHFYQTVPALTLFATVIDFSKSFVNTAAARP